MIRTSFGYGRYAEDEYDVVFGTVKSWEKSQPNGVVYCHGSGDTALIAYNDPAQYPIGFSLGRFSTVVMADLGYQTWGNDTGIERVGQAVSYLRDEWGVDGPVALVAGSMGFSNAAAYTLANPDEVLAIAGMIPLTDIADIMLRGAEESVNDAYPPAYDDETDGPTHSPIHFADQLPAGLPIHFWTASNDPIVVPATSDAFIAARPQTVRTDVGPLGHSDASVVAATPGVVEFVRSVFN